MLAKQAAKSYNIISLDIITVCLGLPEKSGILGITLIKLNAYNYFFVEIWHVRKKCMKETILIIKKADSTFLRPQIQERTSTKYSGAKYHIKKFSDHNKNFKKIKISPSSFQKVSMCIYVSKKKFHKTTSASRSLKKS